MITYHFIPHSFISIGTPGTVMYRPVVSQAQIALCPVMGLISGLLIGIITEYYTSKDAS